MVESTDSFPLTGCSFCGNMFESEHLLKKHIVMSHGSCKQCGKTFSSKTELSKHVQDAHTQALLPCIHCGKNFSSPVILGLHMRGAHPIHDKVGKREFPCSQCVKSYKTKDHLRRHLNKEHCNTNVKVEAPTNKSTSMEKETSFKKETFIKKETSMKKDANTSVVKGEFTCSKCDKSYVHMKGLRRHQREIGHMENVVDKLVDKSKKTDSETVNFENVVMMAGEVEFVMSPVDQSMFSEILSEFEETSAEESFAALDFVGDKVMFMEEGLFEDVNPPENRDQTLHIQSSDILSAAKPFSCNVCGLSCTEDAALQSHLSVHIFTLFKQENLGVIRGIQGLLGEGAEALMRGRLWDIMADHHRGEYVARATQAK